MDNIKVDLAEIGWGYVDWNSNEPSGAIKCS
jgi:hypothetical protein